MSDLPAAGVGDLLGESGPFARMYPGFRVREGQRALIEAIAESISSRTPLVAEAGTGTGKTFAYLAALIQAEARALISTGTKTLQDQLFHRDLPQVLSIMGVQRKIALLKGRANYLCLYRLDRAQTGKDPIDAATRSLLRRVEGWGRTSNSGDLAEYPDMPEDPKVRMRITSNSENCLGSECPFFDECFVFQARRRAGKADLVVVNHHLLLADMALKREGFGELLPDVDAVIIDEAHRLPETATRFFGEEVSGRSLLDLTRDVREEASDQRGALASVLKPCESLEQHLREFRLELESFPVKSTWPGSRELPTYTGLQQAVSQLASDLEPIAAMSPGLAGCWQRALDLEVRLGLIDDFRGDHVAWYERSKRGFSLRSSPLDVSAELADQREGSGAAWVFTSATLAAGQSFELFCQQMGLAEPAALQLASPFDYGEQCRLYLPRTLVDPQSPHFIDRLMSAAVPVLEASGGGAFLLFTSYRNLYAAATYLRRVGRWPMLVQGEAPRHLLVERFKEHDDAILLGAASFWEGVDVAGEQLRCLIIDKLPFASPDDPVLQARIKRLREAGGDAFGSQQLPQAVLTLKQGFGRLIRNEEDYGVVMIGDPRITSRSYGRVFLKSLPQATVTDNLPDVIRFYADKRR